jgi:uncharacterized protein YndB with AHSA1/START domain
MKIDQFKPMTVYTIYIAATPEAVWQALTSAEFSRKYFFGNAVEVDLKVGGTYIVRQPDGADRKAGPDTRDLRDRACRRCRPAHHDRGA